MTLKTAYSSLRKKGIKKYLRDYLRKKQQKNHRQKISSSIDGYLKKAKDFSANKEMGLEDSLDICLELAAFAAGEGSVLLHSELLILCRAVSEFISERYKELSDKYPEKLEAIMNKLWEVEKDKSYNKYIKAYYIKDRYPEIYDRCASSPIEDKVIMLESGFSPSPSSRHLSEVLAEQGKYRIVFVSLRIRAVPMSVFYENGKHFIKELATAKALFLSTANDLLSHFDVREETKVIQLWHGVGAFKHVGYSNANNKNFGRSQKQWEEYDSYRNYSAFTIAAEGQRWIFEESTHLKPEIIRAIGVSRTDLFFDDDYKNNALRKLKDRYPQIGEKKIVLYAPTFRGAVNKAKAPDRLDVRVMADELSDEYVLLIKHHGLSKDVPPVPEDLKDVFVFDLNADAVLSIDELLVIADILITDYSSVAFEYAITERPILFFVYDLEDYIEQRGLYFDFKKDAPGPLCRDTRDIINCIFNIEDEFDKEKLLAFKREYVAACDGHATERTIALIEG